jgi:LysM repeat protein
LVVPAHWCVEKVLVFTRSFYDAVVSLQGERRRILKKAVGKGPFILYIPWVKPAYIYRRRRVVAALLATVVPGILYAGTQAGADQPHGSHVVTPGDTLWSIVIEHYPPSEDPRVAVEAVREANGLEGYRIQPGEHLQLPQAEA